MKKTIRGFGFVLLGLLAACNRPEKQPVETADLILQNGRIVTLDTKTPEAQAIAVKGDRIQAVGTHREILRLKGPGTRVIDLKGKLAIPGFIEGHGHFLGIGTAKLQLDLLHVKNWEEVVSMVTGAVRKAKPGQLIQGRGWHQDKWDRLPESSVDGLPTHHSLSAVSPDNPVVLRHASGHASFANGRAMELAGITAETADPDGGQIVRSENGEPIGVFRETAARLLSKATEAAAPADYRLVAKLAMKEVLSKGVTSFQDAGSYFPEIKVLKELADEGKLAVRLWLMLREPNDAMRGRLEETRIVGYGNHYLTIRAIKRSIDGALGSHGAWLLKPYEDLATSAGLNTTPIKDIEETARLALKNGYQLCVHAIGDRGNRETLDIFEKTFGKSRDLRWRVEHAQHLDPADIPRFAGLGVIASMQGVHCTSDGPWVPTRIGHGRAEAGAYVWRSLLESGAVIVNGTDAPVEDVSPIMSYYATVSRIMKNGKAFYPGQSLTRLEALRSYTLDAAYGAFEEDLKGSLTPGKLADITVLSRDILKVPVDRIPGTEVIYTIVGGLVRYDQDKGASLGW